MTGRYVDVADEPDDAGATIRRLNRLADIEFSHGECETKGVRKIVGGGGLVRERCEQLTGSRPWGHANRRRRMHTTPKHHAKYHDIFRPIKLKAKSR